jgi:hypothetical protein
MILTSDELVELTERRRSSSQVKVLRFMGIEHRVRPDGSVAVLRAHVEATMGGGGATVEKKQKPFEPNWAALGG